MSIDKISALLAKAESTDNEAEREAYFSKAQMLATSYSIDLAVARAAVAKSTRREIPEVKTIRLAEERGKDINKHLISLMCAVTGPNDLRINIHNCNTRVILFGFPSDMEVAEALFATLSHQMVEAADRYIKKGDWKGASYSAQVRDPMWGTFYDTKRYTARSARNAFYVGWISRIGERLRKAQREAIQAKKAEDLAHIEAHENEPVPVTSTELVLKTKSQEVNEHYKKTSQARGSWKGSNAARGGAAGRAGSEAANSARISSQRGIRGKAGALA